MQENERIMNSRMAHIAEEKVLVEKRINDAATTIQKYVRMRIQRKAYIIMKEESEKGSM